MRAELQCVLQCRALMSLTVILYDLYTSSATRYHHTIVEDLQQVTDKQLDTTEVIRRTVGSVGRDRRKR